jgi:hypothetical protein
MTAAAASKGKTSAASKAATSVKKDPQPSTVSSASVKPSSPPKKRKRATKKPKTAPAEQQARAQAPTPPPAHILVIDNGGDTIKFGWNTDSSPKNIPNVTARLQQQWTVLAGDQLSQIQNPNQL